MNTWHYHSASGSTATTPEENLTELVKAGTLTPQTLVWTQGSAARVSSCSGSMVTGWLSSTPAAR